MENNITLSLTIEKLIALLEAGHLSGADIRTNDPGIKSLVQEVCLKTCMSKICKDCDQHEACAKKFESNPIPLDAPIEVMIKDVH